MPLNQVKILEPEYPAGHQSGGQIPKCPCRCGNLTVSTYSASKSQTYQISGFDEVDENNNPTNSGIKYLTLTISRDYIVPSKDPNAMPDTITQTTTQTLDPATGKYNTVVNPQQLPPNATGPGKTTYQTSSPYTSEAFLSDSKAKFDAIPFPESIDLNPDGSLTDASYALGVGPSDLSEQAELSTGGVDRTTSYVNSDAGYVHSVTYASVIYLHIVVFPLPWLSGEGASSIEVSWRERKDHYTGSESIDKDTGEPDDSEDGSVTFTAFSESLTPTNGDKYVATGTYKILAEDLATGDTVRITGPAATKDILNSLGIPGVGTAKAAYLARKAGAAPFIRTDTSDPVVPLYLQLTASGSTDGGEATWDPDTGQVTDHLTGIPPGYDLLDDHGTGLLDLASSQGKIVAPTKVTFQNGLTLILSSEYSTADLVQRVQQARQALEQNTPGFTPPPIVIGYACAGVAERFLSKDEQTYRECSSRWSIGLNYTTQSELGSRYGKPPLKSWAGSVSVSYTRIDVDLDTGERHESPNGFTVSFDSSAFPVFRTQGTLAGSPPQQETVPQTNQLTLIRVDEISSVEGGEGFFLYVLAQLTEG